MSIYSKDRWFVISQKHTVCTLCPNDGAILWYVLLSYKKTLQNKCVCIYCFSLPKLTWQFCSGRRGHENHTLVNVQTEGAFTNYIYELIWQEREALVLYSPFFLMLAIIEYTVCNGNWSPTLIQGGGTPTLFGIHFVHWNNEAWNTAAEFFPLHCILLLMCHSLLVNSNPRQFKGSWFEYSKKSCRRWLIKIENLFPSRIPCLCVV